MMRLLFKVVSCSSIQHKVLFEGGTLVKKQFGINNFGSYCNAVDSVVNVRLRNL